MSRRPAARPRSVKVGSSRESKRITSELLRKWPLPEAEHGGGKDARGCVLVVGGSVQVPGAVILAGTAALRAGAGKLQIATSSDVAPQVAVAVPEARVLGLAQSRGGELAPRAARAISKDIAACDALLLGPGMMDERAGAGLLEGCGNIKEGATLIVDSAPMMAFRNPRTRVGLHRHTPILTPHAGEMATLWRITKDDVTASPLQIVREAAARFGAVVVLKGARTYIAAPDGTAFHNTAGNHGLGTSGSGDVLAGVIAGLCARGASALQATVWGVFLHARAGEILARKIGPQGYLARELPPEIPALLGQLRD